MTINIALQDLTSLPADPVAYIARNPGNPSSYNPLVNNTAYINMPGYTGWLKSNGYCLWGENCSVAQTRPAF